MAGAKLDISYGRLEHVRGDLLAAFDDLVRGTNNRIAADDHRLRTASATAGDQLIAVALQQVDALEWNAEPGSEDLGEGGPVPLTVIEGAGNNGHVTIRRKSDAAHLAARRASEFEIVADAAAAQLPARPALLLAF